MKTPFLFLLCFLSCTAFSQFQVGIFGGASNYEGDLADRPFVPLKAAVGISAGYSFSPRFTLRSDFTMATVAGADKYGHNDFQWRTRNLSFESKVKELNLVGELNIFNTENIGWSPYVFGGIAFFHFNPYTFDDQGQKLYLPPLSTEGQGLAAYPDRKPYQLSSLAIPFGGGLKVPLSSSFHLGVELGIRKTFTDYLDDISTTYVDGSKLREERGGQAVDFSYRGDEVPGETALYPDAGYPREGAPRGSPIGKDWYYFSTVRLIYRFVQVDKPFKAGRRGRRGYGCPANIW